MQPHIIASCFSLISAFSLMTIRSGSQFQYASVKLEDDDTLGLKGSDIDNMYIHDGRLFLLANGETSPVGFTPYPNHFPQTKDPNTAPDPYWAVDSSNHLTYNGSSAFYVCSGWNNKLSIPVNGQAPNDCSDAVNVILRVNYGAQDSTSAGSTSTSATTGAGTAVATSAITSIPLVTTAYHTQGGTTWFTTWTTAWTTSWATSWYTTFACHC